MTALAETNRATSRGQSLARLLRTLLPALSLVLVLLGIAWLNPRAISYLGFNLMLNLAVPIALATIAQMFVITINELDLSIGPFVGFVGCITATLLRDTPLLGVAVLLGSIGLYAMLGDLLTQQSSVVIERLTLVSTIFLPLTLGTGFFGTVGPECATRSARPRPRAV